MLFTKSVQKAIGALCAKTHEVCEVSLIWPVVHMHFGVSRDTFMQMSKTGGHFSYLEISVPIVLRIAAHDFYVHGKGDNRIYSMKMVPYGNLVKLLAFRTKHPSM